jgi:hypothetical protein
MHSDKDLDGTVPTEISQVQLPPRRRRPCVRIRANAAFHTLLSADNNSRVKRSRRG